jgi:hypothetical protein
MRVDMGIGADLRDARLRAGLSVKQLADRIKLKPEKIEALEKSDFTRLPRGIYLDGIVRAYAREVGVDAKLAVERLRDEIAVAEESARLSEESAAWISEKESTAWISEKKGATKHTSPAIAPLAALSPRPAGKMGARPPSVVLAPKPEPSSRRRFGTRSVAFAVLGLLAAVASVLYLRSAMRPIPDSGANGALPSVAQPAAPDRPAAVDGRRAGLAPDVPARAVGREAPASIATATPVARPASVEPPGDVRVVPELPGEPASAPPVDSPDNITGTWDLTRQIESASTESDRGLRLGYRIDFRQNGDQIRGSGYKSTENGAAIAADDRTPITLQGTRDGRELVLTFTEKGALGTSNGRFVLILGDDLALRGSFQSDGAKSRGSINARRRR